jgi:hypothetical protein
MVAGWQVTRPNAAILYRGPSMLDGAPIVVVATGLRGKSSNVKTGNVVQTWILREDADPLAISRAGRDASICGECPHRRSLGGSCYVTLHQAPLSVWRAYARGSYGTAPLPRESLPALFEGRTVRLGSYGDPAAVPLAVWESALSQASGWLGYSHQWRRPGVTAAGLGRFTMASCDSEADRAAAVSLGWRTFRVRTADAPVMRGEFVCPASAEAGKRRTCETCGACAGADPSRPFAVSPVIIAHGGLASRFVLRQVG